MVGGISALLNTSQKKCLACPYCPYIELVTSPIYLLFIHNLTVFPKTSTLILCLESAFNSAKPIVSIARLGIPLVHSSTSSEVLNSLKCNELLNQA